jgi:hypothetical protein
MTVRHTAFRAARTAILSGASALLVASAFAQATSGTDQVTASKAEIAKTLKAALASGVSVNPDVLGAFNSDNVYTALTPCRIVDTRIAGGALAANVTRTFDVDGSDFTAQGGSATGCGIPYGVASSVAMTIHPVTPSAVGAMYAWGLGAKPIASVINFVAGQTIANTTIVPVVPGAGNDFSISSQVATHVVIDVVGYFAAPVATALNCTNVASTVTTIPYNSYTAVDAVCPAGYTVTGGGSYPTEGTLGRPAIWIDGSPTAPNGWRLWVDNQTGGTRTVQAYAVCCRVPGR